MGATEWGVVNFSAGSFSVDSQNPVVLGIDEVGVLAWNEGFDVSKLGLGGASAVRAQLTPLPAMHSLAFFREIEAFPARACLILLPEMVSLVFTKGEPDDLWVDFTIVSDKHETPEYWGKRDVNMRVGGDIVVARYTASGSLEWMSARLRYGETVDLQKSVIVNWKPGEAAAGVSVRIEDLDGKGAGIPVPEPIERRMKEGRLVYKCRDVEIVIKECGDEGVVEVKCLEKLERTLRVMKFLGEQLAVEALIKKYQETGTVEPVVEAIVDYLPKSGE